MDLLKVLRQVKLGVKLFNEFDLDIHRVEIATTNERMELNKLYTNYIEKSIEIAGYVRRKHNLLKLYNGINQIDEFFKLCKETEELIEGKTNGSIVAKIQEFHVKKIE